MRGAFLGRLPTFDAFHHSSLEVALDEPKHPSVGDLAPDDLDSQISLRFLARFECQQRADWLTTKRLAAWLKSVGYCGHTSPDTLITRLREAPRGAVGDHGEARAHTTRAMHAVLTSLVEQIKTLEAQIAEQLAAHADAHIFQSLPKGGTVRAARLLAEIGDARGRFPTPRPWPAWPESHPPPDSPANTGR